MTKPLEKVYVLRTCNSDMISKNGFKWPEKGFVKCKDWKNTPNCGNGLHGFLWGVGNASLANWSDDAKWLVVEVFKKDIVDLGDKVKFPKGKVVYCGDRKGATDFLQQFDHTKQLPIMGCTKIGGYDSTLIGGYESTLTGGKYSILTGGKYSILTGGDMSTLSWKIFYNGKYRIYTFYVGENDIKPNTKYTCSEDGKIQKA